MRVLLKTSPKLPFEREVLKMDDGGQVALDWLPPQLTISNNAQIAPIVLILPGLTGSTCENYILHLAKTASYDGYRVVVFNNRGNGGVDLVTPQMYSAAYTDDLKTVVHHIHDQYPKSAVMAVGFSIGGMILFNYVATRDTSECGLKAAMVLTSPWNAFKTTESLEKMHNRFLFNYRLTKNLCQTIERNRKILDGKIDVDFVLESQLIREFDERCVVPMFKYKDVNDYYRDASFYYKINSASVPTLCLNAADDCFAPTESIPLEEVQKSDNVMVVITTHGGHLGFMKEESPLNRGLIEDLFSEYAKVVFELL